MDEPVEVALLRLAVNQWPEPAGHPGGQLGEDVIAHGTT
jgi:hypothetical protein